MTIKVVNMLTLLYAAGLTADVFSCITNGSFDRSTYRTVISLFVTYTVTLILQYISFTSKQRYEKETHIIIGVNDLRNSAQNAILLVRQLMVTVECIKKYSPGIIEACLIHDNGSIYLENYLREEIKISYGIESLMEIHADYALMIGFHSKSGGTGRFPHSFRDEIHKITISDREIGEVFLFSDYLEKRGTRVIFISGEGNFEDEIEDFGPEIYMGKDEEEYVETIRRALCSIGNEIRKSVIDTSSIRVYMNNADFYKHLKGKYRIKDDCVEFTSTENFFSNIIDFCIQINKAKCEIHKKTIQLIELLRGIKDQKIIKNIGDDYLGKDIELFCEADRERIKEIIGYEEKIDKYSVDYGNCHLLCCVQRKK